MKKLIFLLLLIIGATCATYAQDQNQTKTKKVSVGLGGGFLAFTGNKGAFLAFAGPKLSTIITARSKVSFEIGAAGYPGLYIPFNGNMAPSLGLGGFAAIKKSGWKAKPVLGFSFLYYNREWVPVFGAGLTF